VRFSLPSPSARDQQMDDAGRRARRRIGIVGTAVIVLLTAVGVVGAQLSGPVEIPEAELHAKHNHPGNPITYPLAEKVRYVTGDNTSTGGHVGVEGNRLYVGAYGLGFRMFDISTPSKPRLIGEYMPGVRADAPPDAAVFDGRHIAVLNGTRRLTATSARTDRTEFLDVTKPSDPKLLWEFVGPADGESHNGDIVDARRLYLPSGGIGVQGLRIYDLRPLLGETPQAPANLFRGDPVALWDASPYRQGRPVGRSFTHTHDLEVYVDYPVRQADGTTAPRDIVLLAEGGNYTDINGDTGSIFVIDISDPRNPVVLNRWLHERGPGHHPIRYHHEVQFLAGDPHVMLVTDEDMHNGCGGAGGITALRVSDDLMRVTEELSEWFIPLGTPAPVCSVHVFSSHNDVVFLGSYNAGLQVVDYADPKNPERIGYYIAPGTTAWGALYHKGYIYVGDMARGLDVFEYEDPDRLLPKKLRLPKV
jgi:hypothetical protein